MPQSSQPTFLSLKKGALFPNTKIVEDLVEEVVVEGFAEDAAEKQGKREQGEGKYKPAALRQAQGDRFFSVASVSSVVKVASGGSPHPAA